MNRYLVLYGANNDMMTFEADDHYHAIEQFLDCGEGDRDSITEVNLVSTIHGWEDEAPQMLYACGQDGSWFGASDLSLVLVPQTLTDADEIEDFIVNHREED